MRGIPLPPPSGPEAQAEGGTALGHRRRRGAGAGPSSSLGLLDQFSGALILFLLVFTPWAFGTTQAWSLWGATTLCGLLGVLLVAKICIRRLRPPSPPTHAPRGAITILATTTFALLGIMGVSIANARGTWDPGTGILDYLREPIRWLPTTYDRASTLRFLATYLGLACAFWAIRDWLRGDIRLREDCQPSDAAIPTRVRLMLWVLCLNGAALALVCCLQRAAGTSDLLWLVKSKSGKTPEMVFGPWSYRSNGAQYFNLLWPICLGYWLWLQEQAYRSSDSRIARFDGPQLVLIPCAVLLAASPVISGSRAAALVAAGLVVVTVVALLARSAHGRIRRPLRRSAALLVVGGSFLALATGWRLIWQRLQEHDTWIHSRVEVGTNPLTALLRFSVPVSNPPSSKWLLGLTSSREEWWRRPGSFQIALSREGALVASLRGNTTSEVCRVIAPGFRERFSGKQVTVAAIRDDSLRMFVDGELLADGGAGDTALRTRFPIRGQILVAPFPGTTEASILATPLDGARLLRSGSESLREVLGQSTDSPLALLPHGLYVNFEHRMDWESLRMRLSGRDGILRVAQRIAEDYPVWGTGVGSFEALYSLYRQPHEAPASYAHNDWLELKISLGWAGFILVLLGLAALFRASLFQRRSLAPRIVIGLGWIGLSGCLVHAVGDLPFRVYSVFFLFVALASLLAVMGEEVRDPREGT